MLSLTTGATHGCVPPTPHPPSPPTCTIGAISRQCVTLVTGTSEAAVSVYTPSVKTQSRLIAFINICKSNRHKTCIIAQYIYMYNITAAPQYYSCTTILQLHHNITAAPQYHSCTTISVAPQSVAPQYHSCTTITQLWETIHQLQQMNYQPKISCGFLNCFLLVKIKITQILRDCITVRLNLANALS